MQVDIDQLDLPTLKSLLRGSKNGPKSRDPFITQELPRLTNLIQEYSQLMNGFAPEFLGMWRKADPEDDTAAKKTRKKTLRSQPGRTTPIFTLGDNDPVEMARRMVSPNSLVTTGMFPSFKMKNNMPWEGFIELCAMYLFEVDPNVVGFWPQPSWMTVMVDGKHRNHCPDFFVQTHDNGGWFVETKSDAAAEDQDLAARSIAVSRFLAKEGFGYHVLWGSAVRAEPRLYNTHLLYHHAGDAVHPAAVASILTLLQKAPRTIHSVAEYLQMDPHECFRAILHMVTSGTALLDWSDRFHFDSVVRAGRLENIQ